MPTLPEVPTADVFPAQRNQCQASMMSQRVKVAATKTQDLSLIPRLNPLHGEKREHSYRLSPDHSHNCKIILHFQETTVIYTQVQALLYFTPSVEEHKVDITKAWAASALRCSSAQ